ncbi:MAG: PIG-L family deacetylase [Candidatus Woesearchaeota archaeon]
MNKQKGFFINEKSEKSKKNKIMFLIITAHPDDETIFSGGILARYPHNSFVFCSSHGLGFAKKKSERKTLKKIREKEFKNAMKKLGVKFEIIDDIDRLNYHSMLKRLGNEKTQDRIKTLLKPKIKKLVLDLKPNFVITHNSFGEYGHFLHKTIYKAVFEALKEIKKDFNNYKEVSKLKLMTFAPKLKIRNINTNRLLKTKHQTINYKIILSKSEFNKKLSALKCYSSQKSVFEANKEMDFRVENYHLVF